jgi:hypothetical protein
MVEESEIGYPSLQTRMPKISILTGAPTAHYTLLETKLSSFLLGTLKEKTPRAGFYFR